MSLSLQYCNSNFRLFEMWTRMCQSNTSKSNSKVGSHFLLRSFPTINEAVKIPPTIIGIAPNVGIGQGFTNTVGFMLFTMVDTTEWLLPILAMRLIFSISIFFWKSDCYFHLRFPE